MLKLEKCLEALHSSCRLCLPLGRGKVGFHITTFCSLIQQLAAVISALPLPLPFSMPGTVSLVLGCFASRSLYGGHQFIRLGWWVCRSAALKLLSMRGLLEHMHSLFRSLVGASVSPI